MAFLIPDIDHQPLDYPQPQIQKTGRKPEFLLFYYFLQLCYFLQLFKIFISIFLCHWIYIVCVGIFSMKKLPISKELHYFNCQMHAVSAVSEPFFYLDTFNNLLHLE